MDKIDVEALISKIRIKLPLQNPLSFFVHNNPLQEFESLPQSEGILKAAALYRARPFLSLDEYSHFLRIKRAAHPEVDFKDWIWRKSLRAARTLDRFRRQEFEKSQQDFLIPLVSTFLDQGMAHWQNPFFKDGIFKYFRYKVFENPFPSSALKQVRKRLNAYKRFTAEQIIATELGLAGLHSNEFERYALELLFALKGWSGMVSRLELFPQIRWNDRRFSRLDEWLAVLLIVESSWNETFAITIHHSENDVSDEFIWDHHISEQQKLDEQNIRHWGELLRNNPKPFPVKADFQVLTCMDDREESLRRHLEEENPRIQTFGTVGFFGLDMYFHAYGGAAPIALCPPVITPRRHVYEYSDQEDDQPWLRKGKVFILRYYHYSRSLLRGALISIVLGIATSIPSWFKVFFPTRARQIGRFFSLERFRKVSTRFNYDSPQGFQFDDQVNVVERILQACGLTKDFSPIVVVLAHGSTSSNNPFRQAYGCGACSGNSGKPNSMIFCEMANHSQVRKALHQRGVVIPETTVFIPACHDTTTDQIEWLEKPEYASLHGLAGLKIQFESALNRNAKERCQKFGTFDQRGDVQLARIHVTDRALDLAQPRPEYGHNRVSACFVGRRASTYGLNLDRRAFLVSYDFNTDPDGCWLKEAVYGTVPVAANIIYDYNFSRWDPDRMGAGSKLPLNLTGFFGVMTGSKSDLRIGLPRQMTELHVPYKPLIIVESPIKPLMTTFSGHPRLRQLILNQWIDLYRFDSVSRALERVNL